MKKNLRTAVLFLLIGVLPGACQTLDVRIDRTPTPDFAAIGTLASLMLTGTQQSIRATEMNIPATPTPEAAQVHGKICYPSERIPPMVAFFRNLDTDALIELVIEENQPNYTIQLPEGTYYAYAWAPQYQVGGMYTMAVSCGLGEECTDHRPLAFEAIPGRNRTGIDLCDWVIPAEDLPTPPGRPVVTPGISPE